VSRRRLLPWIAVGLMAFVAISWLLARWLSTENRERAAIYALLRDQARGDAASMLKRIDGCSGDVSCRSRVERSARMLRRSGTVKILAYQSSTSYALGGASGPTRVAWTVVDNGLPVVQCVLVRRAGNVLAGRRINLLRLSLPIDREGSC
jgi:hypothetical protein